MPLIDTAEMYGHGGAEELVGEASAGRQDDVFLVSKVLPSHATEGNDRRVPGESAPDRQLIGPTSTSSTGAAQFRIRRPAAALERLQAAGLIRHWGVSNFEVIHTRRLLGPPGRSCCADQPGCLQPRAARIELTLLTWCRAHGLPVMASSPLE